MQAETYDFTKDLIFPVLVALAGGFALYWFKYFRARGLVRQALTEDINLLLRQCADYQAYLSLNGHDWLKKGETIFESPVFVSSNKQVFAASLPFLWLLTKKETKKIFRFYSHVDDCEKLIEILFLRIQKLEANGQPLTEKQIALIKGRRDRIVAGLTSLLKSSQFQIIKINELPDDYDFPTGRETAVKLGKEFLKAQDLSKVK